MEKFTNEDLLTLIRLYRQHECLWKISCSLYKRADLKDKAYQEIGEVLAIEAEMVKKKLKSLRGTYVLEKKKISQRTQAQSQAHKSTWYWFDEMSFIDSTIKLRKCTTPINIR